MPRRVVPKPTGTRNVAPEWVWRWLRAIAAGFRPRASTSARWSMIIVTGSSGAKDPSAFLAIHPCSTATAAYRYQRLEESRSGNAIEGPGAWFGANALTSERARYFRVSIACGWNGYVPSSFATKSRIQSFVAATNRMPSFAQPSDAVRSEKWIWDGE